MATQQETLDVLNMSRREFIELNTQYIDEVRGGEHYDVESPMDCPLAQWVIHNHTKCPRDMVANTAACPLCGEPMCPDCMNHKVSQLSRVTGYLSTVESWGAAKKQEFKDRMHHNV